MVSLNWWVPLWRRTETRQLDNLEKVLGADAWARRYVREKVGTADERDERRLKNKIFICVHLRSSAVKKGF